MAKQDDYVRYTIRVPADLYENVKNAAGEKSINAEIIDRLERSFAPTDLFAMGEALAADKNDPQALAFERDVNYRNWLNALTHMYAPGNAKADAPPLSLPWAGHLRPYTGTDLVHIDEDGLTTLIQTKVSRALDASLKTVTQKLETQWLEHLVEIYTTEKTRNSGHLAAVLEEIEANFEKQRLIAPQERKSGGSVRATEEGVKPRRISRRRARQMQQEAEDAPIFRRVSPGVRAYWARKAAARKREAEARRAKHPTTTNLMPLSKPQMDQLLRVGVRPAKLPEEIEKALQKRKTLSAAKESRIRDPNEPRAVRDPAEPRAVRSRKKAPKDDDAS